MSTQQRPGLARTDRGVSRPLRAWLGRALEDDSALDELALAWSAHALTARRQLASLLFRDLSDDALDPARGQALFAAMLALEDDRALQADLLTKLSALEPTVAAFLYGDERVGGALVVRERGRRDWDCLLVDWSNEAATRVVCTSVAADAPAEVLSGLRGSCEPNAARDEAWHEVAAGDACQRLALPLLRFTRRGGELPPEAERFASVVTRG